MVVLLSFYFYYDYSVFLWYLRVTTERLCSLIHFILSYDFHHSFVTSSAHMMAIWPFLSSSFSYVKDLVVHLAPQCLFPN